MGGVNWLGRIVLFIVCPFSVQSFGDRVVVKEKKFMVRGSSSVSCFAIISVVHHFLFYSLQLLLS